MKIRNAQCFSCLCVQSRKNANRKTFAPQLRFSLMNVFFIKIKIFVGEESFRHIETFVIEMRSMPAGGFDSSCGFIDKLERLRTFDSFHSR